jgi:hypothetical protein
MAHDHAIDVTFDFRRDTPVGGDPDALSPTLRRYHRLLWSKPLPSGVVFALDDSDSRSYLRHRSALGEFRLSSDSVIPTFRKELRLASILSAISDEARQAFGALGYTIGGMMLFPSNKVDGRMTINGARGCHPKIKDRFDLTVECIRRHYQHESSPLSGVLDRYATFFEIFGSFAGYVEFFLLQDLVSNDASSVRFSLPFDDFNSSPVPDGLEAYEAYVVRATHFLNARNQRIQDWLAAH